MKYLPPRTQLDLERSITIPHSMSKGLGATKSVITFFEYVELQ